MPNAESDALRLATAKAVCWLAKPLNRVTLWAARVVVEDRLAKAGLSDTRSIPPGKGEEG